MPAPLDVDASGYPVLLAAPDATVVKKPEPVAAEPAPKPVTPSTRPATVDHVEWSRRQDAVRDAAREFEDLTEQDLRERLRGATTKPLEDADLAQFRADVRAQVLDDLIDALDQRTRGKLRGRRTVRVVLPNGYLRKTLRSLDAGEADQVESRLRSRGWTEKQVTDDLRSKLKHLEVAPDVDPA